LVTYWEEVGYLLGRSWLPISLESLVFTDFLILRNQESNQESNQVSNQAINQGEKNKSKGMGLTTPNPR
jgi:hypothetical protein